MGKKTVKVKTTKHDGKKPKSQNNPDSYDSKTPVWAFKLAADRNCKWAIYCDHFTEIGLWKLHEFEGMTWADIKRQTHDKGKSSNHFISLDSLCEEAKAELNPEIHPVDQLFSLRIDNLTRLYGFLEQGVFYLFWYDQKHEIVLTKKDRGTH